MTTERGCCPVCGRWIALRADGTLRQHCGPGGYGSSYNPKPGCLGGWELPSLEHAHDQCDDTCQAKAIQQAVLARLDGTRDG